MSAGGMSGAARKLTGELATVAASVAAPERARPRLSLLVGIALIGAAAATAVAYHVGAGTYVVVTLERHDDELDLTILDDGVGFDYSARAAGIGLVSMRDRLGAVG